MKVNLAEKLALIQEHWSLRICAELNGSYVKLVKLQLQLHEADEHRAGPDAPGSEPAP